MALEIISIDNLYFLIFYLSKSSISRCVDVEQVAT